MPVYVWQHKETGEVIEVVHSIADSGKLPDSVDPADADNWRKLLNKPTVLKRLIPSGFGIRNQDQSWVNGKEIAKLEDSRMELRPGSKERSEK